MIRIPENEGHDNVRYKSKAKKTSQIVHQILASILTILNLNEKAFLTILNLNEKAFLAL